MDDIKNVLFGETLKYLLFKTASLNHVFESH